MVGLEAYNISLKELPDYYHQIEPIRIVEIDGYQVGWMKIIAYNNNGKDFVYYDLYTQDALKGKIVERNGKKEWEAEKDLFYQKQNIYAKLATQLRIFEVRQELIENT